MFVLCPHCQFLVAVDPVNGQPPMTCPRCDGAMAPQQVGEAVTDDTITSGDDGEWVQAPGSDTLAPHAPPAPEQEPESVIDAGEVAADAVEPASDVALPGAVAIEAPMPPAEPAPAAASPLRAAQKPTHKHWRMPLVIAGLTLLLVLQMLLADRTQLAADARWRPVVSMACAVLRCELPPWHEPTAFTLVDRDVRSDPDKPGVLHVSARFRNDARWPQSWPRVLLTLSDVDGRVAGARLFAPREYAATGVTRKSIASGQVAQIAMDVVEPAPDIVAFTFDFR